MSLDAAARDAWLGSLLAEHGTNILRAKGIVDFDGDDFRLVFHAAVFIGRHLDRAAMQAGFAACAMPADHPGTWRSVRCPVL